MSPQRYHFDDEQQSSSAISYLIQPMSHKIKGNNIYGNVGTRKCEQCRRRKTRCYGKIGASECEYCAGGKIGSPRKVEGTNMPGGVKDSSQLGDAETFKEFLPLGDLAIFNRYLHNSSKFSQTAEKENITDCSAICVDNASGINMVDDDLKVLPSLTSRVDMYGDSEAPNHVYSSAPIGIDEYCLSEASSDLIETFKYRFPEMDSQIIERVVQNASDIIFKDSKTGSCSPSPKPLQTPTLTPSYSKNIELSKTRSVSRTQTSFTKPRAKHTLSKRSREAKLPSINTRHQCKLKGSQILPKEGEKGYEAKSYDS